MIYGEIYDPGTLCRMHRHCVLGPLFGPGDKAKVYHTRSGNYSLPNRCFGMGRQHYTCSSTYSDNATNCLPACFRLPDKMGTKESYWGGIMEIL